MAHTRATVLGIIADTLIERAVSVPSRVLREGAKEERKKGRKEGTKLWSKYMKTAVIMN